MRQVADSLECCGMCAEQPAPFMKVADVYCVSGVYNASGKGFAER